MNTSVPAVGMRENDRIKRYSRLGLTSFLIAITSPVLLVLLFVVMVLLQDHIENGAFVGFVTILAAAIAGIAVHLTGLIIGIAGVSRKETKKLLPVLGITLNALPLVFNAIVCILFVAFLTHPFPLGPK